MSQLFHLIATCIGWDTQHNLACATVKKMLQDFSVTTLQMHTSHSQYIFQCNSARGFFSGVVQGPALVEASF